MEQYHNIIIKNSENWKYYEAIYEIIFLIIVQYWELTTKFNNFLPEMWDNKLLIMDKIYSITLIQCWFSSIGAICQISSRMIYYIGPSPRKRVQQGDQDSYQSHISHARSQKSPIEVWLKSFDFRETTKPS